MYRILACINLSAIAVFAIIMVVDGTAGDAFEIDNSILGQLAIAYAVIGAVVPWVCLVGTARESRDNKRLWVYFISTVFLAWYYLLKLSQRKSQDGE